MQDMPASIHAVSKPCAGSHQFSNKSVFVFRVDSSSIVPHCVQQYSGCQLFNTIQHHTELSFSFLLTYSFPSRCLADAWSIVDSGFNHPKLSCNPRGYVICLMPVAFDKEETPMWNQHYKPRSHMDITTWYNFRTKKRKVMNLPF